jgi:sugar lactone lactonase YvrE
MSGYLYVARSTYTPNANEILVYSPKSAKPVQTITDGLKGGFAGTDPMAFDASGNLYVASYSANTVTAYAPGKTSPSYQITKGMDTPYALAVDSAGNLFVLNCPNCAYYNHKRADQGSVAVYARGATSPSYTITKGIHNPIALAFDRSDNLYVASCPTKAAPHICTANYYVQPAGGTVTVYPPGKESPAYTISNGIDAPRSLAIDSSGALYVGNIGDATVAAYKHGTTTPWYDIYLGVFDGVLPTSMAFDRKGNLYVAMCSFGATGRVCIYPPGSATPIAYYQTPPNYNPRVLAFDHSGNLYVLDIGIDVIRSKPGHRNQVAIFVYAPETGTPFREISTGINYAMAMAINP